MKASATLLTALFLGFGLLSCKPAAPPVPGVAAANADYNDAEWNYSEGRYAEAIPHFESAMRRSSEAAAREADQSKKAEAIKIGADAAKYLAESQYEAGKRDQARREELWRKAEPTLKAKFDAIPADAKTTERRRLAVQLRDIAGIKGDTAAKARYEGVVKEIDKEIDAHAANNR